MVFGDVPVVFSIVWSRCFSSVSFICVCVWCVVMVSVSSASVICVWLWFLLFSSVMSFWIVVSVGSLIVARSWMLIVVCVVCVVLYRCLGGWSGLCSVIVARVGFGGLRLSVWLILRL